MMLPYKPGGGGNAEGAGADARKEKCRADARAERPAEAESPRKVCALSEKRNAERRKEKYGADEDRTMKKWRTSLWACACLRA
jgi:hypothetical protein